MKEHKVKILKIEQITPSVKSFMVERPKSYSFISGSHTHITFDDGIKKDKHPFTICSLAKDDYLEFIIKEYPGGITEELHKLKEGDEIIIEKPAPQFKYKGKGVFIAAGTGVTPFICMLRDLRDRKEIEGNRLILSNKKAEDVILRKELKNMLDDDLILTFTKQKVRGCPYGRIDAEFLKEKIKDFDQYFYICGPKIFVLQVKKMLLGLGTDAERIIS